MEQDDIPPNIANLGQSGLRGRHRSEDRANGSGIGWDYWGNLALVDYSDACILSLGFEPRVLRGNVLPSDWSARIKARQEIARSHLGHDLAAYETESDIYYGRGRTGVKLQEFRAWGEALRSPFTFPDEFPKAAAITGDQKLVEQPAQPDKSLGERERTNLLRIMRALLVMAKLPERGATGAVEKQLQELGFDTPKEATIRNALKEAQGLQP